MLAQDGRSMKGLVSVGGGFPARPLSGSLVNKVRSQKRAESVQDPGSPKKRALYPCCSDSATSEQHGPRLLSLLTGLAYASSGGLANSHCLSVLFHKNPAQDLTRWGLRYDLDKPDRPGSLVGRSISPNKRHLSIVPSAHRPKENPIRPLLGFSVNIGQSALLVDGIFSGHTLR